MMIDPELHDLLVNYGGFVHTRLPCAAYDSGDAESGPELCGDMYESLTWRYIIDWRGVHVLKIEEGENWI